MPSRKLSSPVAFPSLNASPSCACGKHAMCLVAANGSDQNIEELGYSPCSTTSSMVFGNLAHLSELHCPRKQN